MKLLIFVVAIISAANGLSQSELWNDFKHNYSKTYKNLREDALRFSIFQMNLKKIDEHNSRYNQGLESYFLKITALADLTDEEFNIKYLSYQRPQINYTSKFELEKGATVPEAIDWRTKGAVLEVKTQGECGACYAFSTTGALEAQNAIKHNKRISLSEQEIIDCSANYLNFGCDGGSMERSFRYVQDYNGISTEKSYPYEAKQGGCRRGIGENTGIKVQGYVSIDFDEEKIKSAVGTVGPVSVAINSKGIKLYGGGIFDDSTCTDDINHGVLIVGYGTENKKDYWIIKNSWGPAWGEKGYLRIVRNKKMCGLSIESTYPIIA